MTVRRCAVAVMVVLSGCASGLAKPAAGPLPSAAGGSSSPAAVVPADMLNPSVTQATLGSTICVAGYTARIGPPVSYTEPLKVRQLVTYGYADRNPSAYEEDHAEALESGGAPKSPSNLFPEPHSVSFADDAAENVTHADICAGRITLAAGQLRLYHLKVAHGYNRAASLGGAR